MQLKQILLTHVHIDHAGGTGTLARTLGLPIIGPHPGDQCWIDGLAEQARMFGFALAEPFTPTRWLADGDRVTVGHSTLAVRHCPGHTDFPGGDHDTLIASITQHLWPMGDATVFIPGHGPESSFGVERRHNPDVGGT